MLKSFSNWNAVNEKLFNREKGEFTIQRPGQKKEKVIYKIKNDNELIIKMVRTSETVVNDRLTQKGTERIIELFNVIPDITQSYGTVDANYFKEKFIVYKVKRESDKVEKIAFNFRNRVELPNLPQNVQFISTDELKAFSKGDLNLTPIATETETIVNEPVDGEPSTDSEVPDETGGTEETKEEAGKKFLYTMRTNAKNYLMEFLDDGSLDCECRQDGPDGSISYDEGKIYWHTEEDANASAWANKQNSPMMMDMEITNPIDVQFFKRVFTDDVYRINLFAQYEKEFGVSEVNAENIKNMLYHIDGTKMFAGPEDVKSTGAYTGKYF